MGVTSPSALYVDSETLAAVEAKAAMANENLGHDLLGIDATLRFRGDPVVLDPRLDKLRERVVNLKDDDSIPVDRPTGYSAAHERALKSMEHMAITYASEIDSPVEHPPPWYLRLYGLVDPVEFWVAVAMLSWLLYHRLSF